jgi:shikimate kinase
LIVKKRATKNIFLIGFMGAGKSSVGRILSDTLNLAYCDIDEEIEERYEMKIYEIFQKFGEDYFRDIETQALRDILNDTRRVIATGGGVVLREENWEIMERAGITVYLRASLDSLWSRIKDDADNVEFRPLLLVKDPLKRMSELLSARIQLYEKAAEIVDTDNLAPEEVAKRIIEKWRHK